MANPKHIKWLLEGLDAWNERRRVEEFSPDFEGADITATLKNTGLSDFLGRHDLKHFDLNHANLKGAVLDFCSLRFSNLQNADLRNASLVQSDLWLARLIDADLRESDLSNADLSSAMMWRADLRGAKLLGTEIRGSSYSRADVRGTDLSFTSHLNKNYFHLLNGDEATRLPSRLTVPENWLSTENTVKNHGTDQAYFTRYTPPAEFETKGWQLIVQYVPRSPEPRQASSTPIDLKKARASRVALSQLAKTFCSALRKYGREDAEQSNRVRQAEQLLITTEALVKALQASDEDFLPILLEDYIETLALGFNEDVQAFEQNDIALYQRLVARGRQLYAFYPELEEISDPTNTRFISDDFPYTLEQLKTEVQSIVFSDEGLAHFSDSTRELIEAEINAKVPRAQDEKKTKLARLGAIVGEMHREMIKYSDKAQNAIDKGASWIKSYEKVDKIWDTIKEFIGHPSDF